MREQSNIKQDSIDLINIVKEPDKDISWLTGGNWLSRNPYHYGCSPWLSVGLIEALGFYTGRQS